MTVAGPDPAALLNQLHPAGDLPAGCSSAFLAVRREDYTPERVWVQDDGSGKYVPIDGAVDPRRWLAAVYSNRAIVTQFDDGHTRWPEVGHRPTCSASMPSAVAGMLAELDPQPGDHVMEVGLGTGFNAALLGHVVGPTGHVASVEIDRWLAGIAAANLTNAGVANVDVLVADATTAALPTGLDRVLVTASVRLGMLPYSWVANTRPGGVLVVPMRADLSSGPVVRFVVGEDGTATGRATSRLQVGFMELRGQRITGAMAGLRWDDPAADMSHTDLDPFPVLTDIDHRWPLAVALPYTVYDVWDETDARPRVAWLRDPRSGSWATVAPDGDFVVRQVGPRRLWDAAVTAYRWWQERGAPPLHEWIWSVGSREQGVTLP